MIFKNEIVGPWDPSNGIQATLNPFYKQSANYRFLPYKSIKSIISSFNWPTKFTLGLSESLTDEPHDLIGITNDGITQFHIYSTSIESKSIQNSVTQKIQKISIDSGLSTAGYNHFGDGSFYFHPELGGLVFLPVGGSRILGEEHVNNIIAEISLPGYISLFKVKDGALQYLSGALLKTVDFRGMPKIRGEAEWCALNPLNGLLYTAERQPVGFGPLHVYKPIYEINQGSRLTGFSLDYLGDFPLFDEKWHSTSQGVTKGGVFSSTGHLYVTLEAVDNTSAVAGFDMISGRKVVQIPMHLLNLKGIDFNRADVSKVLFVCATSPQAKHSQIQHIGISDTEINKI